MSWIGNVRLRLFPDEIVSTAKELLLIKHNAWCEGRDSAADRIQNQTAKVRISDILAEEIRALKSPYEEGE